jgi:hypothetical protein
VCTHTYIHMHTQISEKVFLKYTNLDVKSMFSNIIYLPRTLLWFGSKLFPKGSSPEGLVPDVTMSTGGGFWEMNES